MATRDATVHWSGTIAEGSGQLTLESSNLGPYPVSWPTRSGDPDGQTSPEELIAGAHASCLAMNLAGTLAGEGLTPETIDVSAAVTLGEDPAGGFRITGIDITIRATVPGVDADRFAELAATAERTCPVTKALTGTTISLDAALDS